MNNSLTVLRSILFPKKGICDKTELYYRTTDSSVCTCKKDKQLHIRGTVSFDTYFNSLSVKKYEEYCKLSALFLRLKVCGFFVLRIFGVEKNKSGFTEKMLIEKSLHQKKPLDEIIDLSAFLGEHYAHLYFTLSSENGTFYGGEFLAGSEKSNGVHIAVVICTYRRELFLLKNYQELTRYLSGSRVFHPNNIHCYIVDNGRTLDKATMDNEYITLIPNDNTGGSGGFARGYYEAVKSGKDYTHILFMDDDIVLHGEMLLRVHGLLKLCNPSFDNLAVGGTMLKLSDYITQHEAGAVWDGKRLHSIGNGEDMTQRENVFGSAFYPQGNYNAWWFYCFPARWQKTHGYPLPFFVKEDDIEYSLRCHAQVAAVNGIAVWHDDFDGKYDGFQEYYIKRNELILTSVNHQRAYPLFQIRKLILGVMKQTVYQCYFLADLIFKAYNDYLRGWKHFQKTDTIQLNQELMSACQPLIDDAAIIEQYGIAFDPDKHAYSLTEPESLAKQFFTLNGYLLPTKDNNDIAICDLAKCRAVNFYRRRRVLHYDPHLHKGYVTQQKRRLLWWNMLRLCGYSLKFLFRYPFVRRGYRKHLPDLTQFHESKQ